MDRKEFLGAVGIGTTAILYSVCFNGCKPLDNVTNPTTDTTHGTDLTINLDDSANAALKTNGGYIVKDGIIIARTLSGTFLAVSAACTHQGTSVEYQGNNNRFHCPNHGSNFATDGSVINGPASTPLKSYNTSLNGSLLRITN
jgi:cytochrome b6-f complex iron-sulfur subunit